MGKIFDFPLVAQHAGRRLRARGRPYDAPLRSHAADVVGLHKIGVYFSVFSFGLLRYFVHGVPEILSYFVGGLAGGIISVAVIKHDLYSDHREKILFDASELVLIAVGLLVVAAMLEVTVTPLLF